MFSEDVVGLVEEMGFQPSSELSSTDGCWVEVDREGIPDDWCCNVEAPPTELSSGPWHNRWAAYIEEETYRGFVGLCQQIRLSGSLTHILFGVALQEIKLNKFPAEKLGISVRGGIDSLSGNPHDDTDKGIFISKVPLAASFLLCD